MGQGLLQLGWRLEKGWLEQKIEEQRKIAEAFAAARNGNIEILALMINADQNILNLQVEDGDTIALLAARNGLTNALQLCIKKNHTVLNQRDNCGNTPAILAASGGHTEMFELCLNKSKKVLNQSNQKGGRPADCVVENGHTLFQLATKPEPNLSLFKLLLDFGIQYDSRDFAVADFNNLEVLKILMLDERRRRIDAEYKATCHSLSSLSFLQQNSDETEEPEEALASPMLPGRDPTPSI